jgi:hypothetical protein
LLQHFDFGSDFNYVNDPPRLTGCLKSLQHSSMAKQWQKQVTLFHVWMGDWYTRGEFGSA